MIPDSEYVDVKGTVTGIPGKHVIEDYKGMITDVFRIKVKLFHGMYPAIGIFVSRSITRKGQVVGYKLEDYIPIRSREKRIIIQNV